MDSIETSKRSLPNTIENKRFIISLTIPLIILLIIWLIKIYEVLFGVSFYDLGIYPRSLHGLIGILTAPLIHGDFNHIYFNSIYWLILSTAFFYFFPERAYRYFVVAYFLPGILVWLFARPSFHIGLSGVIYALVSFLFFVNLLNKDFRMMSVSLIIIFLFSGMIAGIFPKDIHISWESHLAGVLTGMGLAINEAMKMRKKHDLTDTYSTTYFDSLNQFENKGTYPNIRYFYSEEEDRPRLNSGE